MKSNLFPEVCVRELSMQFSHMSIQMGPVFKNLRAKLAREAPALNHVVHMRHMTFQTAFFFEDTEAHFTRELLDVTDLVNSLHVHIPISGCRKLLTANIARMLSDDIMSDAMIAVQVRGQRPFLHKLFAANSACQVLIATSNSVALRFTAMIVVLYIHIHTLNLETEKGTYKSVLRSTQ